MEASEASTLKRSSIIEHPKFLLIDPNSGQHHMPRNFGESFGETANVQLSDKIVQTQQEGPSSRHHTTRKDFSESVEVEADQVMRPSIMDH